MDRGEVRPPFSPGEPVSHTSWGVGRVIDTSVDASADIIVEFLSLQDTRRMTQELAHRALKRLPPNGLEAKLIYEPERIKKWSREAPLKLVAIALVDLGRPARPSDLQSKLARQDILDMKWTAWWKRVQPILKQSPYFRIRYDGTYELQVSADEIPESPITSTPKRPKATPMSKASLDEAVRQIESGELKLDAVNGADNMRLLVQNIIQRGLESQQAGQIISKAMSGPTPSARVILDELLRSDHIDDAVEAINGLINHCLSIVDATPNEEEKRGMDQLAPKTRLTKDVVSRLLKHNRDMVLDKLNSFVPSLLELSVAINNRGLSAWASESLGNVCSALGVLAQHYAEVIQLTGQYLCAQEGNLVSKVQVVSKIVSQVPLELQPSMTTNLLLITLNSRADVVEACLSRLVDSSDRINILSTLASHALVPRDVHQVSVIARLLTTKSNSDLTPQEHRQRLLLALACASVNPEIERIVNPLIREDLTAVLTDTVLEEMDGSILDSIAFVLNEFLRREKQESERVRLELESEIARIHSSLQQSLREKSRLQDLSQKLEANYRLPQQWAIFRGRQEAIRDMGNLYQETFLAQSSTGINNLAASWIITRVESLLQRYGVVKFGRVSRDQSYDPARHEYLSGYEGTGGIVRLVCPGFEWRDPAGNMVVLTRAKVVGLQEGKWATR